MIIEVKGQNTILINSLVNAWIAKELKKITDLTTESMNKYNGEFAALNQETLAIRQQITDVGNAVGTTQQLLNDTSTSIQKQISGVDNRVNVVGKAVGATQQLVNDRIGSVQSLVETMNRNRGMIENGDPNYMNRLPSSQQPTGNQLALTQGIRNDALGNEIYQRSIQLPVQSSFLIGNDFDPVNQIVPILITNDRMIGATINSSDIRDVKQDFVRFFEMLLFRSDNGAFVEFTREVGLSSLFSAFRQRTRNGFYNQLFNKIDNGTMTEQDLNEARNAIPRVNEDQLNYEQLLRNTNNQLTDILNKRTQRKN